MLIRVVCLGRFNKLLIFTGSSQDVVLPLEKISELSLKKNVLLISRDLGEAQSPLKIVRVSFVAADGRARELCLWVTRCAVLRMTASTALPAARSKARVALPLRTGIRAAGVAGQKRCRAL
jgi:hypothetical protein